MALIQACKRHDLHFHRDCWRTSTPYRVFWDLKVLDEERRLERVRNGHVARAAAQENVSHDAFLTFMDTTD